MGMYRVEWDCCGSVTETEAWEPERCPFCYDYAMPFRRDAERYRFLRQDFSPMGLSIDGQHAWAYRRNATLKGSNLDAAIDAATAKNNG